MFGSAMLMAAGGRTAPKVNEVFATTLFTANGTSQKITNGINNVGSGGLVWEKSRTSGINHYLVDTSRGGGASLSSNSTDAQLVSGSIVPQFHADGFSTSSFYNAGTDVAAWNFREAPFFFAKQPYTGDGVPGRQVAHNLGIKPGLIFVHAINATGNWPVYHQSRGGAKELFLNQTVSESSGTTNWNNTDPTDSVFSLGSHPAANASGVQYIAFLFAHDPEPDGIIQCGQYTGNGTSNGPIIPLGWEPQYVFGKRVTTTGGNWTITDAARDTTNPRTATLFPHLVNATVDDPGYGIDFNPTGFQIRSATGDMNSNGQIHIYMAIRKGT